MPVLETTDVQIKQDTDSSVIRLYQASINDAPYGNAHLHDVQLYPMCNEAFISRSGENEPHLTLAFKDTYAPHWKFIEDALLTVGAADAVIKKDHHNSRTHVSAKGAAIPIVLDAFAKAQLPFGSSLHEKQAPQPAVNDELLRAIRNTLEC